VKRSPLVFVLVVLQEVRRPLAEWRGASERRGDPKLHDVARFLNALPPNRAVSSSASILPKRCSVMCCISAGLRL
jgi:hypothetical protein